MAVEREAQQVSVTVAEVPGHYLSVASGDSERSGVVLLASLRLEVVEGHVWVGVGLL
jgi:hypothetical protein